MAVESPIYHWHISYRSILLNHVKTSILKQAKYFSKINGA